MKCPHCGYEHEVWDDTIKKYKKVGDRGDFFQLPIKMERAAPFGSWMSDESALVYACPKCGILFAGV